MEKIEHYLVIECSRSNLKLLKISKLGHQFQLVDAKLLKAEDAGSAQREIDNFVKIEDLKKQNAIFSINSLDTCFTSFIIPELPKKEIAEAIKWKIKDDISFPVEEALIDYRLIKIEEDEKPHYLVLVSATPQDSVNQLTKNLPQAKAHFFSHSTVAFEIGELTSRLSINSTEHVMIIDIGCIFTEIFIYSQGRLNFLRKIAFGVESVNQAMSQSITSEKGTVKLTHEEIRSLFLNENLFEPTEKIIVNKMSLSQLHPLIRPEFEKLTNEINRSSDYFVQQRGKNVSHIFLTGELVHAKGLNTFLASAISQPVKILNLSQVFSNAPKNTDLNLFFRPISLVLDQQKSDFPLQKKMLNLISGGAYLKTLTILFSVWVLIFGVMALQYMGIQHKSSKLNAEIKKLTVDYDRAQTVHAKQAQLNIQNKIIDLVLTHEPIWNNVFLELSNVFPKQIILTDINFDQDSLVINGISKSTDEKAVSELLFLLEGPIFKKVTLIRVEKKENETQFSVRCAMA